MCSCVVSRRGYCAKPKKRPLPYKGQPGPRARGASRAHPPGTVKRPSHCESQQAQARYLRLPIDTAKIRQQQHHHPARAADRCWRRRRRPGRFPVRRATRHSLDLRSPLLLLALVVPCGRSREMGMGTSTILTPLAWKPGVMIPPTGEIATTILVLMRGT